MTIPILIADDHAILREGLRSLLEKERDFQVVGEAADGRTAIELAESLQPKVVIMDIGMPELNGVEATRRVMDAMPTTKIIALSVHSDQRFVSGVLRAGASGYVLKQSAFEELARAIRVVADDEIYLSPAIGSAVLDDMRGVSQTAPMHVQHLSAREREFILLIGEGKTTKQTALAMKISDKTVHTRRPRLFEKLSVKSDAELIKHSIRIGLIILDQ